MKTDNRNYLESIFKSAECGMTEFNMPLTNEGKFEVLMYGIWLGMKTLDGFGIPQNYKDSLAKVNDFLIEYAKRLGISPERKAERLFVLRDEDWEKDTISLLHSNYPKTKQFLPEYLYLCFIDSPLVLYGNSFELSKKTDQIDSSKLIDFLGVFEVFYNKLIKDFKSFEPNTNSDISQVKETMNRESYEEDKPGFKTVYEEFEKELTRRINVKDLSEFPHEDMLYMPTNTLSMLDRLAVERVFSFKILDMSGGVNSISELMKKDLDYLQKNRKGVIEFAKPMLEEDIATRKRCVALLRSMDDDKYVESKDDLESVIAKGDEMLNKVLKSIDSGIKFIDTVIDIKTKKTDNNTNQSNKKSSNAGCMSFLAAIIVLSAILFFN